MEEATKKRLIRHLLDTGKEPGQITKASVKLRGKLIYMSDVISLIEIAEKGGITETLDHCDKHAPDHLKTTRDL